jgi:hypothetical protein
LSHTWGEYEANLADMNELHENEAAKWKERQEKNWKMTADVMNHTNIRKPDFGIEWVKKTKASGLKKIDRACQRAKRTGINIPVWIPVAVYRFTIGNNTLLIRRHRPPFSPGIASPPTNQTYLVVFFEGYSVTSFFT